MESKKINQLATELTPSLDDLTIIGDPSTGISKKITLSQMAALFTGTVEEYASLAAFPLVGVADTIYIATDTNILYRWSTSLNAYVELSPNIISSLVFNDSNGFDGTISLVGSTATLTITTTLTSGSVAFGGASGALSQDNTNFYWDNSNKRLGINTNAPTVALDAFGSGIIGRINGTSTNNAFLGFASAGTNKWSIGNVQSDHRFRIYNEATTSELVSVLQTGEFGIGIANPTTKFHIDGAASALIVNLDANVSIAKSISFRSDNSNRWNIEVSGTESTGNAGMDFFLRSYTDAGALIETPLSIVRSTGVTTIKSLTLTNALSAANGGTGITSYTIGDLIYASGATTLAKLADVATGNALISGGVGVAPSWGKIDLTTTITGTLPVANGGTGATTFTAGRVLFGNGTSAINTSANLFWDNTNGRLGIGLSSPTAALEIFDNTNSGIIRLSRDLGGQRGALVFGRNNSGTFQITSQIVGDSDSASVNNGILSFWTTNSSGVNSQRLSINGSGLATFTANVNTSGGTIYAKVSGTESSNYQLSAITMGYDSTNGRGWITAAGTSVRTELVLNQGGGNVGVGVIPTAQFHVGTTTGNLSHFGGISTTNTHYTGISLGYREASGYAKTAIVQEQIGDGAARGHLHFLVDVANDGNSAILGDSKMMIHGTSGNVLIGTTTDSGYKLDISGNCAATRFWVASGGNATDPMIRVKDDTDTGIYFPSANEMAFATGANTVMRMTSGGQVICSTGGNAGGESTAQFLINGSGYSGFHWLDATAYYIGQNSSLRELRLYSGGPSAGVKLTNGSTSWGTYSDERLKTNIEDIGSVLNKIKNLRTIKYHLKNVDEENRQKRYGLIAQDLVGKFDEVLSLSKYNDENPTEYYDLRYTELIPILVKAIQEQQVQIEELKLK